MLETTSEGAMLEGLEREQFLILPVTGETLGLFLSPEDGVATVVLRSVLWLKALNKKLGSGGRLDPR